MMNGYRTTRFRASLESRTGEPKRRERSVCGGCWIQRWVSLWFFVNFLYSCV